MTIELKYTAIIYTVWKWQGKEKIFYTNQHAIKEARALIMKRVNMDIQKQQNIFGINILHI